MRKKGFTFVEILVVLALVGVLTVAAIGPIVHLVGLLRDARLRLGESVAVEDGMALIFRDIRSVLPVGEKGRAYSVIRRHDIFGGRGDDVLAVASGSLLGTSGVPGTVVYRLVREGTLGMRTVLPGLYRWIFQGRIPEDLDLKEDFPMEEGALVIPYVDSFRVEFYEDQAWVGDYGGAMPSAARVRLERKGETYEVTDWLPSL